MSETLGSMNRISRARVVAVGDQLADLFEGEQQGPFVCCAVLAHDRRSCSRSRLAHTASDIALLRANSPPDYPSEGAPEEERSSQSNAPRPASEAGPREMSHFSAGIAPQ